MTVESGLRSDIVRYCARLWDRRLVTGSSGNVSARMDNGDLLITPAGLSLAELDPSQIVRVDAAGVPYDPALRPTSEMPLHVAAYRTRPRVRFVVHTHPTFCVVWSRAGRVFPQDTVGARETLGPVAWAPYAPPGTEDLARTCAQCFAAGFDTVLMERHGLSTVGETLEAAFLLSDLAEEAARVGYFGCFGGPPSEFTGA